MLLLPKLYDCLNIIENKKLWLQINVQLYVSLKWNFLIFSFYDWVLISSSVGWIADHRWKINSLIYYQHTGVPCYGVSLHIHTYIVKKYLFLIFAVSTTPFAGDWYQIVLTRIWSTWVLNYFYQMQYAMLAQEKQLLDGHPRWTWFDSGQEQ